MTVSDYILNEIIDNPHIAVRIQSYPDRLFGNINVIINLFILKNRYPVNQDISCLVLCQEKVQIKCNQFSLFLAKFNLLFLLHSFRCFQDIVPHIHLETNIRNDCECARYYKMFRCIQKSAYMHVRN